MSYARIVSGQTGGYQDQRVHALKVGDKMPDIVFENIINYPSNTLRLADFKGKPVILDFWATWCVPCVAALPKLQALQKKFSNDIVILPVTSEKTGKVLKFFNENSNMKDMTLPTVTNTSLNHYFPHRSLPHVVWIDAAGKLMAATTGDEVTESNIVAFLAGRLDVETKNDVMEYDIAKPLFLGGLGSYTVDPNAVVYGSVLAQGRQQGVRSATVAGVFGDVAKVSCTNGSLQSLYQAAFTTTYPSDKNDYFVMHTLGRLLWEASDTTFAVNPNIKSSRLMADSLWFSYELILPQRDSTQLSSYMAEDLNRFFGSKYGIEGVREKRKVKCWVLTGLGNLEHLKSKESIRKVSFGRYNHQVEVSNINLDTFISSWVFFSLFSFPYPIINETNYGDKVNFSFSADPTNFEEMKDALESIGLEFSFEEREIDMIVIKNRM